MPPLGALRAAADGLANHPQDHGWRALYELFRYGLSNNAPRLGSCLAEAYQARPLSATHLLTLLGIALKANAGDEFAYLTSTAPLNERLPALESVLQRRPTAISSILLSRQNSFTCARRFLVTRVLLDAYFSQHEDARISFVDLGTGLGVLPRQLNSESQYRQYAAELIWPGGIPQYHRLPLAAAFGVDRRPMPTADWVRQCYGLSDYYDALYDELQASLHDPQVRAAAVEYRELDLLDTAALVAFIQQHRINAANLTYVLYEMEPERRAEIIDIITRELYPPALLLVTEPREELHREGCVVEVFSNNSVEPATVCFVSDGHFRGYILPLDDYADFVSKYPIAFQPATENV
jgi:hypothetical protein